MASQCPQHSSLRERKAPLADRNSTGPLAPPPSEPAYPKQAGHGQGECGGLRDHRGCQGHCGKTLPVLDRAEQARIQVDNRLVCRSVEADAVNLTAAFYGIQNEKVVSIGGKALPVLNVVQEAWVDIKERHAGTGPVQSLMLLNSEGSTSPTWVRLRTGLVSMRSIWPAQAEVPAASVFST